MTAHPILNGPEQEPFAGISDSQRHGPLKFCNMNNSQWPSYLSVYESLSTEQLLSELRLMSGYLRFCGISTSDIEQRDYVVKLLEERGEDERIDQAIEMGVSQGSLIRVECKADAEAAEGLANGCRQRMTR